MDNDSSHPFGPDLTYLMYVSVVGLVSGIRAKSGMKACHVLLLTVLVHAGATGGRGDGENALGRCAGHAAC